MAEAIGIASGLLALSLFALKSTTTLYNTISSFQSHNSRVKDLQLELEALTSVLGPLSDSIGTTDTDLTSLDLPLRRCGSACRDFEKELLRCTARSNGVRTSFRDWAKLRYMDEDIDGFKRLIAGYKLTVNIALTHATLRKSSLTAEGLADYKNLIETAQEDLQAHLKSIDEKLEAIFTQTVTRPVLKDPDLGVIKDERQSAVRCLEICESLSRSIDQMQLTAADDDGYVYDQVQESVSQQITREGLAACKNNLDLAVARLERYMKEITGRIIQKSKAGIVSNDDVTDLERLQDEWDATRESVKLCAAAGQHLKNNVSSIENHGVGDSVQFMVSTNGQVLYGRNRGMGWKNRQFGGHMSDNVVLQLSRDMVKDNLHAGASGELPSRGRTVAGSDTAVSSHQDMPFEGRHGKGFKLDPQPPSNIDWSHTDSTNRNSTIT